VARSLRPHADEDVTLKVVDTAASSQRRISVVKRASSASIVLNCSPPSPNGDQSSYSNPLFTVGPTVTSRLRLQEGSDGVGQRETLRFASNNARGIISSRRSQIRSSVVVMSPMQTRGIKPRSHAQM
jgi:hypothetical protein